MREIKFKGKRIDNNEWVYGYFFTVDIDGENRFFIIPFSSYCGKEVTIEELQVEINKETLSQFSGIKDFLEKEIWEGDILEFPFEMGIAYVVNDGFRFAVKSPGSEAVDYEGESVLKLTKNIGNIYENPELL